jgi:hypothetical protein
MEYFSLKPAVQGWNSSGLTQNKAFFANHPPTRRVIATPTAPQLKTSVATW